MHPSEQRRISLNRALLQLLHKRNINPGQLHPKTNNSVSDWLHPYLNTFFPPLNPKKNKSTDRHSGQNFGNILQ